VGNFILLEIVIRLGLGIKVIKKPYILIIVNRELINKEKGPINIRIIIVIFKIIKKYFKKI
jgi:hypothetical protein